MLAKTLFLLLSSLFQTVLFLIVLGGLQRFCDHSNDMLLGGGWMFLALCVVGFASVGLGLLLSAISWKSGVTANVLLPLVMIFQIVFSVVVARDVKSYANGPYDGFFWRGSDTPAAAKASYLTLSRWGDRAIRPPMMKTRSIWRRPK
ncbi:MAG: hypothetical protein H0T51_26115 [Pirellulales bacterium]|nr:hypothetical protein [Pirellulales bacterium]